MTAPIVRPMRLPDLQRVSALSAQLGYPATVAALESRFKKLAADPEQALFVAELRGQLVGWIHVHPRWLLESEPYAEIAGLVVDGQSRRAGAGRALVAEVERWARERKLEKLRVRSNVNREEAHRFYPSLGFRLLKTQHNYELRIS